MTYDPLVTERDVVLREYTPADYEAVCAIWRQAFGGIKPEDTREGLARMVAMNPGLFLVAGDGKGRVVATVIGGCDGRRGYIYHVAVDPEHRRRGLASHMLREVARRIFERGVHKIHLRVEVHNHGAIAMYRRLGYSGDPPVVDLRLIRDGAPGAATSDPTVVTGATSATAAHPDDVPSRFSVRSVEARDRDRWLKMRVRLWPEGTEDEHRIEVDRFLVDPATGTPRTDPAEVLLAEDAHDNVVGFAEMSIRPYAEGCSSRRVAYLEGWYVEPGWRGKGAGRSLVEACEAWGRAQGCSELASDAQPENALGAAAHRAVGFDDVGLVRCFLKNL